MNTLKISFFLLVGILISPVLSLAKDYSVPIPLEWNFVMCLDVQRALSEISSLRKENISESEIFGAIGRMKYVSSAEAELAMYYCFELGFCDGEATLQCQIDKDKWQNEWKEFNRRYLYGISIPKDISPELRNHLEEKQKYIAETKLLFQIRMEQHLKEENQRWKDFCAGENNSEIICSGRPAR